MSTACLAALLTVSALTAEAALDIVDDPRVVASDRIDVGRRFEAASCETTRPGRTILEAIPDAEKILVHQFDGEWPSFEVVKAYIRRLLSAVPEGGKLVPTVYWAEMRSAEIFGAIEFPQGKRRSFRAANGYAHLQDAAGCEWWGGYLGPDRARGSSGPEILEGRAIAALFPTIVGDVNPNVAKAQRRSTSALGVAPLSGGAPRLPCATHTATKHATPATLLSVPGKISSTAPPSSARRSHGRVGARR